MTGKIKKIVLIGPTPPYRGGIAHFQATMARGLRRRGHVVEPVTFRRQYPALLFPGKTQFEPGSSDDPAPRLLDSINPVSWWKTARYVAARQPDAVVFQYWMPFFAPAFGIIARHLRRRGVRVVAVVHNAIPHERRPGDLALSRYFLKATHGCLVLSESVGEDLRRLGVEAKIEAVGHPVYDIFGEAPPPAEARARLGLPAEVPVLLFFGFVRRYKGLHVLLEALPRIRAALPGVRLVVAGEFYDDEAPYRDLIRTHRLDDAVDLHAEYIANEAVPAFFAAADVVVQPYVSATQSGVAQIAFHFDTPAIITDVGGLAEVVPHERAGLVVPPEDPEALAAAVVRFFAENMAARLADGVREEKQKYSWGRLYDALETLMEAPVV